MNKTINIIIIFITIASISCSKNDDFTNQLVGTWEYSKTLEDIYPQTIIFTFNDDYTFSKEETNTNNGTYQKILLDGIYAIKEDQVTLDYLLESIIEPVYLKYSIDEDQLTLTSAIEGVYYRTTTYTKQ